MLQDVKNSVDEITQFSAGAEEPIVFAQTSRGMGGLVMSLVSIRCMHFL